MKPRSKKNKGKRLQNLLRDKVLAKFPRLTDRDVKSTTMGESGSDLVLSQAAFEIFPYDVECKSLARFAIYKHYEQRGNPNGERLLVIKGNHKEPLVIVSLEHFMELL